MSTTAALKSHWRTVSSTDNLQAFDGANDTENNIPPNIGQAITGVLMMMLAAGLLLAELAILAIKAMPQVRKSAVQASLFEDKYYVYLLPLMTPMLLIAVTANWFSLKLFKHNS